MAATSTDRISVLCVDDNQHVAQAVDITLRRSARFDFAGWLPTADEVEAAAEREHVGIVLLDIDMPGRDPFEACAALLERLPEVKAVFFSAHVGRELIDKAVEAGAWGYASKNDGDRALLEVLNKVSDSEFGISPSVRACYGR